MSRLRTLVLLAVWVVGLTTGGFSVESAMIGDASTPPSSEAVAVRFTVTEQTVTLRVRTLWQSEWRITTPVPEGIAPNCSEDPSSARPEASAQSASTPSIIFPLLVP